MNDELTARLRLLEAERLRPTPPAPKVAPSALSRYQALADAVRDIEPDLTVVDVLATGEPKDAA